MDIFCELLAFTRTATYKGNLDRWSKSSMDPISKGHAERFIPLGDEALSLTINQDIIVTAVRHKPGTGTLIWSLVLIKTTAHGVSVGGNALRR